MSSILSLVFKEIRHRPVNALLLLLAVTAASSFVVFFFTTTESAARETRRIQRDGGSNLRLLPRDVDRARYLAGEVGLVTMSEDVVAALAAQDSISMNHLIAILERKVDIDGRKLLLTGIARSIPTPGRPKAPMHGGIEPGALELGRVAAEVLGRGEGDELELMGRRFKVEAVLLEKGTVDDIRVYGDLHEIQALAGLDGRISEIRAIDCVSCQSPEDEPLGILRAELATAAPDVVVLREADRADVRLRQRTMIEREAEVIFPVLLVVTLLCIGALVWMNARDRSEEIGILRAIGYGPGAILVLFVTKAMLIGALGAAIGALTGSWFAVDSGAEIFVITAKKVQANPDLITSVIVLSPLLAALAALLPAIQAALRDPAESMQPR